MKDLLMSQAASLYYHQDMSQQEIAKYLKVSKMHVSRLLQRAKDSGIVHTMVTLPFEIDSGLSQALARQFSLHQASVVRCDDPSKLRDLLAQAAAFDIVMDMPRDTVIGMGTGSTIGSITEHLAEIHTEGVHVVQLMGGLHEVHAGNPLTIIQRTCEKLSAQGTYITSPAVVKDQEFRDKTFADIKRSGITDLWGSCRQAYFGIGSIETGTFFADPLRNTEEMEIIKKHHAAGDILGHCFDEAGNFITDGLEQRLVSIPCEMLRNIPKRAAAAGGKEKAAAITGALKTGMITHMYIDHETARMILK